MQCGRQDVRAFDLRVGCFSFAEEEVTKFAQCDCLLHSRISPAIGSASSRLMAASGSPLRKLCKLERLAIPVGQKLGWLSARVNVEPTQSALRPRNNAMALVSGSSGEIRAT